MPHDIPSGKLTLGGDILNHLKVVKIPKY
jgi:hypothetical protein